MGDAAAPFRWRTGSMDGGASCCSLVGPSRLVPPCHEWRRSSRRMRSLGSSCAPLAEGLHHTRWPSTAARHRPAPPGRHVAFRTGRRRCDRAGTAVRRRVGHATGFGQGPLCALGTPRPRGGTRCTTPEPRLGGGTTRFVSDHRWPPWPPWPPLGRDSQKKFWQLGGVGGVNQRTLSVDDFFYNFCFRGGHGGHGGHGQSIERILTLTRSGVGGSRLQLYTALYRRAARCPTNSLKLVCPRGGLPGSRADEAAARRRSPRFSLHLKPAA